MAKATSMRTFKDLNQMKHPSRRAEDVPSPANDAIRMLPCLGGCGKTVNANAPWGRFGDGGVCGAACNTIVLERKTENLLAEHTS